MLSLVATPIGNLEDMSPRAIETLKKADLILAEDTRKSRILSERFQIKTPLLSYHKFNEEKLLSKMINDLKEGKHIALISDAGTPCINDPGERLVRMCHEHQIRVSLIPGPSAPIMAVALSGFGGSLFQFVGFLPKKGEKVLKAALFYPGTTVAFESPQRIISTLKRLLKLAPDRKMAVMRELTKVFEEILIGTPETLLKSLEAKPPRGEFVLVIAEGEAPIDSMELDELIPSIQKFFGLSLKEALSLAAKLKKIPKKQAYRMNLKRNS